MDQNHIPRFQWTRAQKDFLNQCFEANPNPSDQELYAIWIALMHCPYSKITKWFVNKRMNQRTALRRNGVVIQPLRRRFTAEQTAFLNFRYGQRKRPGPPEIAELADHLGVTVRQIQKWYSNKRLNDPEIRAEGAADALMELGHP